MSSKQEIISEISEAYDRQYTILDNDKSKVTLLEVLLDVMYHLPLSMQGKFVRDLISNSRGLPNYCSEEQAIHDLENVFHDMWYLLSGALSLISLCFLGSNEKEFCMNRIKALLDYPIPVSDFEDVYPQYYDIPIDTCPFCGKPGAHRHGIQSGKQRRVCPSCKKSFIEGQKANPEYFTRVHKI